jgi:hypothetical protein
MNTPTLRLAAQSAATDEPIKAAVQAAPAVAKEQSAAIPLPLMFRTRKVVRLAPPIDSGFRPFRVF